MVQRHPIGGGTGRREQTKRIGFHSGELQRLDASLKRLGSESCEQKLARSLPSELW